MAKRILIADDSVTIQKAFAMTFGAEDVALTAARSADEGLAQAQKARPDLIIADGAMPGRSGYDLCLQIRSDPALRGVPVYILASSQQPYDEAKGQRSGADGHLLKPWETNAFLEKVRDALSRGSTIGAPTGRPSAAPPPAVRVTAASQPASAIEDDYGEISIDRGRDSEPVTPPPAMNAPPPSVPPRLTATSMPAASAPSAPGLRPSLIPGMRPGAMPPARPGTVPVRPLSNTGGFQPLAPLRPAVPPVGRTMIGLPAANVPIPGAMRPSAPVAPPAAPLPPRAPTGPFAPQQPMALLAAPPPPRAPEITPLPPPPRAREMTPAPPPPRAREMTPAPPVRARETTPAPPPPRTREMTPAPPVRAREMTPTPPPVVAASVGETMAAIAAKGPEYEAIAKLSREIIEKIVWEVVPELAEAIIREHVAKRGV
jgi:CheY-like chemotaxis protein